MKHRKNKNLNKKNSNFHINWNEAAIEIINITWKDMFFRKYIPDTLYSDYIEKIIIHPQ
ncbi:hypothetical protein [Halarcobacter bivalviorum]|uniref:hypothetical protein n=1 Tax=Halarcobacter bivalviorum TaxID=663364 RepID=UPI0013E92931|nr:hypothetical protein [Halarcobacter bivalviorum]